MDGTWLVRGAAAAVVAVLVGAWGVGVAGAGDTDPKTAAWTSPLAPEPSAAPDNERVVAEDEPKAPRTRDAVQSRDADPEPSPDARDDAAEDEPLTPAPTSEDPTSDPSLDGPSDSPSPPKPSDDPPSQPTEECTDLLSTLGCVLDPITGNR